MLTVNSLLFFSSLMISAHFLRSGDIFLSVAILVFPFSLFYRRVWTRDIVAAGLMIAAFIWINSTLHIYSLRTMSGQPYVRMVLIMSVVTLFTLGNAILLFRKRQHGLSVQSPGSADQTAFLVFMLSFLLLSFVRTKVTAYPMLLADRFYPGAGWLQILLLSFYGAWAAEQISDPKKSRKMRLLIWTVFSIVFFSQLLLGLLVSSLFLMTGKLHIPVPSIILLGPLYRGEGLFMPILFLSTVILVGPAWCSHLCYFGAWDNRAALQQKRPTTLGKWAEPVRLSVLVVMILVTLLLRTLRLPSVYAAAGGLLIGGAGIAVMFFFSRRTGTMIHCRSVCPIGLLASVLGRINPLRIRINDDCNECNACHYSCRYDALSIADIQKRRAAYTCTLCGDCISSCSHSALEYRVMNFSPARSRQLFLVLVLTLHTAFMGLARI